MEKYIKTSENQDFIWFLTRNTGLNVRSLIVPLNAIYELLRRCILFAVKVLVILNKSTKHANF